MGNDRNYTIDLDQDPYHRWDQVGQEMAPKISAALETVQMMLSLVPGSYDFLVQLSLSGIDNVAEPYRTEMKGMSAASGISLGEIALMNVAF